MYCKQCGKQILDDSVFCNYCGSKQSADTTSIVNEKKMRNVTIKREKKFSGCVVSIGIFIDDSSYAVVKNGETVTFKIDSNQHRIYGMFEQHNDGLAGMKNKGSVIFIEEGFNDIIFELSFSKAGFFTPSVPILERC